MSRCRWRRVRPARGRGGTRAYPSRRPPGRQLAGPARNGYGLGEESARMRVLHLTTEFPPIIYGGLGTAVGGLVNASARTDMTVAVLLVGGTLVVDGRVSWSYGRPVDGIGEGGPRCVNTVAHDVEFFQVPWHAPEKEAVAIARNWKPDIIHLHTHWIWPAARAIQEEIRARLIYTVHSVDRAEYELGEEGPNLLDRCDDQAAALTAADRVVTLTRHER